MNNILGLTLMHMYLSVISVLLAILVGVPLGIILIKNRQLAEPVMTVTEIIQTIPGLALLAFVMMIAGLGDTTLVIALFLYSLMPVVRNTFIGIRDLKPGLIEAGKGMGMTWGQRLRLVELPLAMPVILAGIRVALVTAIGTASMGVFVGASGLGNPLYRGIQTLNYQLLISGSIPAILLAVLSDYAMGYLQIRLTPKGLRVSQKPNTLSH